MIRSEYSAKCDGCGAGFVHRMGDGLPLAFFSDRDALLVALGSERWGLVSGDTSDPASWSVVCSSCRGVAS